MKVPGLNEAVLSRDALLLILSLCPPYPTPMELVAEH